MPPFVGASLGYAPPFGYAQGMPPFVGASLGYAPLGYARGRRGRRGKQDTALSDFSDSA